MKNLELHPLCALFPPMTGADFEALKADIQSHGLRQPIVVHEGMILDGAHRYRACMEIGGEPTTAEFSGGDPASFVLSLNLHRRHMTPGQQAAVVAATQDWATAHPSHRTKEACNAAPLSTVSDRAATSGASRRTQQMADKVAKKSPELAKKIAHGEVSLPQALKQIAPADTDPATPPASNQKWPYPILPIEAEDDDQQTDASEGHAGPMGTPAAQSAAEVDEIDLAGPATDQFKEIERLRKRIKKLEGDLGRRDNTIRKLEEMRDADQAKLDQKSKALKEKREEISTLKGKRKADLAERDATITALRGEIKSANAEIKKLSSKAKTASRAEVQDVDYRMRHTDAKPRGGTKAASSDQSVREELERRGQMRLDMQNVTSQPRQADGGDPPASHT